ncbi:hypothetical protein OF83DRAFT_1170246 [Amylostereum chailletii]|nr:hypothetical protein OF83DRAFT_1170246 [Amylostereum chailletii]
MVWLPFSAPEKPQPRQLPGPSLLPSPQEEKPAIRTHASLAQRWKQLSHAQQVLMVVLAPIVAMNVYHRFFRRLRNAEWVTPDILKERRWIKGVVTSVCDGDDFFLYHTPAFGWRWPLKFRNIPDTAKGLEEQTIHIRMAGVDAPEMAHFGRPAQPYASTSLDWLKSRIEGKTVYCHLLAKDQYSRIIATPHLHPRILPGFLARGVCVSRDMLRAGLAEVYLQSGAQYGEWTKSELLRIQAEAKAKRRASSVDD